jgi:hypothetical protein
MRSSLQPNFVRSFDASQVRIATNVRSRRRRTVLGDTRHSLRLPGITKAEEYRRSESKTNHQGREPGEIYGMP